MTSFRNTADNCDYCINHSSSEILVTILMPLSFSSFEIALIKPQVLSRDIRHLLVRDTTGKIVSMFSVKDLCKCVVARHTEVRLAVEHVILLL